MRRRKLKKNCWSSETAKTLLLMLTIGALLIPPRASAEFGFTTLFSFQGTNGASPISLIQGIDGNLYGTTSVGGANGKGSAFRFTTDGVFTCLASFDGTNGYAPRGLLQWTNGDLYGMTWYGGSSNLGTIFRLTPGGLLTNLFSFDGTNGSYPFSGLVTGPDGNFYGTAQQGGANPGPYGTGCGTFFRLTPDGNFSLLLSLDGTNGYNPRNLMPGADGDLYGSMQALSNYDNVFSMTTAGDLTTLFSFSATNGADCPYGLIQGPDGTLYGAADGAISGSVDTLFKITTNGLLTTLFSFSGTNGSLPRRPVLGPDGNLYGTTGTGGSNGQGTLFQLTPQGALTTLVHFNGANGSAPFSNLVQADDGRIYGTTMQGGKNDAGTIFRFAPPPVLQSVRQNGNAVEMRWNSVAGNGYQVQFATNLSQTNWTNLGDTVMATNASMSATDVTDPAPSQRFYRLIALP